MTTKVRLVDELIGWYLWKARIADCHKLIKRHIYVDNRVVLNRILECDALTIRWRTSLFVESWRTPDLNEGIKCEAWGNNHIQTTKFSKWSTTVKYQDDPKSAVDYLHTIYSYV